jgi:serine/threonine protein kinase
LRHDNIVRYIGIAKQMSTPKNTKKRGKDEDRIFSICIVTEFCPFGDLSEYMQGRQRPAFQKQLSLMYDIAFGISYLHGRRPAIIHRYV